jgi:hypothetical protein
LGEPGARAVSPPSCVRCIEGSREVAGRAGPWGTGGRDGNWRVGDGGRLLMRRVGVSEPSSRIAARQLLQVTVTNFPATRRL